MQWFETRVLEFWWSSLQRQHDGWR